MALPQQNTKLHPDGCSRCVGLDARAARSVIRRLTLPATQALLIYEQVITLGDMITYLPRLLRPGILSLWNRVNMALMAVCFILRPFSSRTILVCPAHPFKLHTSGLICIIAEVQLRSSAATCPSLTETCHPTAATSRSCYGTSPHCRPCFSGRVRLQHHATAAVRIGNADWSKEYTVKRIYAVSGRNCALTVAGFLFGIVPFATNLVSYAEPVDITPHQPESDLLLPIASIRQRETSYNSGPSASSTFVPLCIAYPRVSISRSYRLQAPASRY